MIARAAALLVVALVAGGCTRPDCHPVPVTPARPDFDAYRSVPADEYRATNEVTKLEVVSFRTPDGLNCVMDRGNPTCTGELPAAPVPANRVGLGGFAHSSEASPPSGSRLLPAGSRIADGGAECAVADGGRTMCRGGTPERWFVLSSNGSGIGPRTEGLPAGFPDPKDYVITDERYTVGSGARNIWVYFTVDSGLTCEMWSFSGYAFGCDGPMPAAPGGVNEVYLDGIGAAAAAGNRVGMRRTDQPKFDKPYYPGEIRRLPRGSSISYTYEGRGACLATFDGGAACYLYGWGPDRPFQGFLVTPTEVRTFG